MNYRWSLKVTDILYGIFVEILYSYKYIITDSYSLFIAITKATIANVLPIGGPLFAIAHLALLYSLYSFEYKWFYQGKALTIYMYTQPFHILSGITVQKRLLYIEPYFLGFCLTLSILTSTPFLTSLVGVVLVWAFQS